MPPLPIITANINNQGAKCFIILNCPLKPVSGSDFRVGISLFIEYKINNPKIPINRNIRRHDKLWLIIVPSGIPRRFANVMPEHIVATA